MTQKNKEEHKNKCDNCGGVFYAPPSEERKYCSQDCYFATGRETKVCPNCYEEFTEVKNKSQKYCSPECRYNHMQEERHPGWSGDELSYSRLHSWLKEVDAKEDECEFCGDEDNLEFALKDGKDYERDTDNFLTLCVSCHRSYDATEEKREKWRENLKKTYSHKNRVKDLPKVECPVCGDMFKRNKRRQKLCSQKCVAKKGGLAENNHLNPENNHEQE